MNTHNATPLSPFLSSTPAQPTQQQAHGAGSQVLALEALGHSHTMDCPAGSEIQVLRGCVWLTCEGLPDDHFLRAGQFMWLPTVARLHLSAEGREPATLKILRP